MSRPRYKWQPLRRAFALHPSETLIAEHIAATGWTRQQVLDHLAEEKRTSSIWKNDLYQVLRRDLGDGTVHLNIRRVDGGPILRDWRHFQQIKNELIGEECEAIEIYPAESRKVDASNKFHLFGVVDPTFRFPFGDIFGNRRQVAYENGSTPGTRQRAL